MSGLLVKKMSKKVALGQKSKVSINALPDELLLKVFEYLDINSLIIVSEVNRKWRALSCDNFLWKKRFRIWALLSPYTFKKRVSNSAVSNSIQEAIQWKTKFMLHFYNLRNQHFFSKLRVNNYTGTTDKMNLHLKNLDAVFEICVLDVNGNTFSAAHNWMKVFNTSTLIQWYDVTNFPSWTKVKCIKVFALTPVICGKLNSISPYQKSLIFEVGVIGNTEKMACADTKLVLFNVKSSLTVALWKDSDDIAFLAIGFHHENVIQKMFLSTESYTYKVPHTPVLDDVDKHYGLHSYNCHLHLHTFHLSIWDNKFSCLNCEKSCCFDGYMPLDIGRYASADQNVPNSVWKTEHFRGILEKFCMLDITVRDGNKEVIWAATNTVAATPSKSAINVFDSSHEQMDFMYQDDCGIVRLYFHCDGKTCTIDFVQVALSVRRINEWFATRY